MSPDLGINGVRPAAGQIAGGAATRTAGAGGESFAASLAQATAQQTLRFSAHATQRLASRNINLSAEELSQVEQATQLAATRGSRDALIMMDNLGLVVNIPNRTVLTALDLQSSNGGGIVTNIDSTVVVRR